MARFSHAATSVADQDVHAISDLLVFGEDWGRHPSSTQHLVQRLASDRRVVWVNSIGLRRPRLSLSDGGRIFSKVRAMGLGNPPGQQAGDVREQTSGQNKISIVDPIAVPWPGNPVAALVNRALIPRRVKPALRNCAINRPILWASLPSAVDALPAFPEMPVVYYCGDDFGALEGVDHRPVQRMEERLVEKADLILAASPGLAERFPAEKTHCVPHGVDFDLFAREAPRPMDLPLGKVAGFYGSISNWLDQRLIAEAAALLPDWTFVFIGDIRTDVTILQSCSNIRFMGPRPHNRLPGYSQNWTASLLPFLDNEQIRACNPLKLREYLAAGRPVISTDMPALDGYRDLVSVVGSAADLAIALDDAARGARGRAAQWAAYVQQDRVKTESWDNRAAQVNALLSKL